MLACQDAVQELGITLKDLYKEKFDNAITKWEGNLQSLQHSTERIESRIDRRTENASEYKNTSKSIKASQNNIKDYKTLISNDEKELSKLQAEKKELQKIRDEAIEVGKIKEDSEADREMQASINDVENSIDEIKAHTIDCFNSMAEETVNIFNDTMEQFDNSLQNLRHSSELTESNIDLRTSKAGSNKNIDESIQASGENIKDYKTLISNDNKELKKLQQERDKLNTQLTNAVNNGYIEKGSKEYYEMLGNIQDIENSINDVTAHTVDCFNSMSEETVNIFENTVEKFENKLQDFQHIAERIESGISQRSNYASEYLELGKSRDASRSNMVDYRSLIAMDQAEIQTRLSELQALRDQLNNALANGSANGGIDKDSKDYYDMLKNIQDVENEIDSLNSSIIEYSNSISSEYVNIFDSISSEYENKLSLISHMANEVNNALEQAEEKGRMSAESYYASLRSLEQENIAMMTKQHEDMQAAFYNALESGEIKVGSQAYYDMQQKINDVTEALQKSETEVIKFNNEIRQCKWDNFDYLEERISRISDEAEFLIELMSDEKMVEDNGRFTSEGTATVGLHAVNYDVLMNQADDYAEKIKEINEEIANDPANKKLIERKEELIDAQQESILAANKEKQAIKSLVKEGIDAAVNSMNELISKYEDAIDRQHDLYEYQKDISNQAKNLASLQKQMKAYEGDFSEETKARVQKLKVEIEEAQQNLKDTEYDHYINEQKSLLDDLSTEFEETLNARLDNIDALFSDIIAMTNQNAVNIQAKLQEVTSGVGYNMTNEMRSIWGQQSEKFDGVNSVVATYGEDFKTKLETTNATLGNVSSYVDSIRSTAETEATNASTWRTSESAAQRAAEQEAVTNAATVAGNTKTAGESIVQSIDDNSVTVNGNIGIINTSLGVVNTSIGNVKISVDAVKTAIDGLKSTIGGVAASETPSTPPSASATGGNTGGANTEPTATRMGGGTTTSLSNSARMAGGTTAPISHSDEGTDLIIKTILLSGKQRSKKLTKDEEKHHELWKYLVTKHGVTPTITMYKQLANALGVNVSKTPTKKEKNEILKKFKNRGFASGLRKAKHDEAAWVNEKGEELILRPSENAALINIKKDDTILDADATSNIWKMANNPAEFIGKYSIGEVAVRDTSGVSSASGASTINMGDYAFNINLPNVTNYEQFKGKLMNDKTIEKYICAVTVDPMLGKNKSAKYRFTP